MTEQIVRYLPFGAAAIAPELRAGHEEHPPIRQPALRLVGAVGRCEQWPCARRVAIQIVEPGLRGALIVLATDPPARRELQLAFENGQQVVAGHEPASKEIARHP